jgi:peptidoglycan hydrolase-like protein with peptidoglycan-binding domain
MNKKKIIIIVIIFLAIGLAIGGYFWWKKKQEPGEAEEEIPEPIEPPPAGTSAWKDESFPLSKGMFGGKIKLVQQKLGLTADGKFGPGTEAAVKAKLGKATVDKADYDKLVPSMAASTGVKPGDHITSSSEGAWVYDKNKNPISRIAKGTRLGIVALIDQSRNMYGYKLSGKPDINYIELKDAKKTYA